MAPQRHQLLLSSRLRSPAPRRATGGGGEPESECLGTRVRGCDSTPVVTRWGVS